MISYNISFPSDTGLVDSGYLMPVLGKSLICHLRLFRVIYKKSPKLSFACFAE